MRLHRNQPGFLTNLKMKLDSQEHRQKSQILQNLFPNTPIKWIRSHIDQVVICTFHLNQTLFTQNSKPSHVFYIIEGEVRLDEVRTEVKRQPQLMMFTVSMSKSRTLLILSAGSLVGEIEALLGKGYQTSARSNVHYTKALLIPLDIFFELKKQNYHTTDSKDDQIILKKMQQIKRRRLELDDCSPERSSPTHVSREEFIVQQNLRIQKRQNFELVNLTPEAPLFNVKKIKHAAPQDFVENRARSISAPTKSKMIKSVASTEKIPEETRSRTRTISYSEKCRPGTRIMWQQIFQNL